VRRLLLARVIHYLSCFCLISTFTQTCSSCVTGGDTSGIDEAIAELERDSDREDPGSGGPVDN
jgi:hypothetical protein